MSIAREMLPRTLIVGLGTLLSRVMGLVREVVCAAVFGTSAPLDAFNIAFMVPNLFRELFGEGALTSAVIPVLSRAMNDPGKDPQRLVRVVLTTLTALLTAISLIGCVVCAVLAMLEAMPPRGRSFCVLLAILLPYMPLICVTALMGAVLNTSRRFFIPAVAPALLNLCIILAAWLFAGQFGVKALAVGALVSGVLQFALQTPFLLKAGWSLRPLWDLSHPGLRQVARLMAPAVLGLGIVQLNVALDQVIAQFCVPGDGANSAIGFANRLMQFPLGVMGLALSTAVFPTFAQRAALGDRRGLVEAVNTALRIALFLALPCMAVILALATPITSTVFQRGNFNDESTRRTAWILFWYGTGLWTFCAVHVLARAFHALQDMTTPVRIAASMVALNLTLNLTLVWPMREGGLALASSLSAIGSVALLLVKLRRRAGPLGLRRIFQQLPNTLAAAFVAGLAGRFVCYGLASALGIRPPFSGPFTARALALGAGMAAALIAYVWAAWMFDAHDLREFAAVLLRRAPRPPNTA